MGRVLWDVHPGNDDTPFARVLRDAMASGAHASGETFSNSIGRWIEYRAYPTEDGLSVVFRDIDERRRHDERLRFLAEASTLLSSSLDYETTLANIAELAVPALASSCVIDLVGTRGRARARRHGVRLRRAESTRRRDAAPESHHVGTRVIPRAQVLATGAIDLLSRRSRPDDSAARRRRSPRLARARATPESDVVRVRGAASARADARRDVAVHRGQRDGASMIRTAC